MWLSFYLYYEQISAEEVLRKIETLCEGHRRFFVRYCSKKPHIRFRIEAQANEAKSLKLQIRHALKERFDSNELKLIRMQEYKPEDLRYGGSVGIKIAEDLFCLSSEIVFQIICEVDSNYEMMLGLASFFQLSFIFQLAGGDLKKAITLANNIYLLFESTYCRSTKKLEDFRSRSEILFLSHRESLLFQVTKFWKIFGESSGYSEKWLEIWLFGLRRILKRLLLAYEDGDLVLRSLEDRWIALNGILTSYIHMTNNRLGIVNSDEAYLSFILCRSLKSLDTHPLN